MTPTIWLSKLLQAKGLLHHQFENIKITIEFDIKDKDIRDDDKSSKNIEKDKELQDTVDTVDDFK